MVGRILGGLWLSLEVWGEIERSRSKWQQSALGIYGALVYSLWGDGLTPSNVNSVGEGLP
jgi:hypothetical protein